MTSSSRRHFLAQTTLGTGALLTSLLACAANHQEKKLGVALVGLGNYATHQHSPAWDLPVLILPRGDSTRKLGAAGSSWTWVCMPFREPAVP